MLARRLTRPEGRALQLYARAPLAGALEAPSPSSTRVAPKLVAGAFTADTLPEEKAAELRAIEVELG